MQLQDKEDNVLTTITHTQHISMFCSFDRQLSGLTHGSSITHRNKLETDNIWPFYEKRLYPWQAHKHLDDPLPYKLRCTYCACNDLSVEWPSKWLWSTYLITAWFFSSLKGQSTNSCGCHSYPEGHWKVQIKVRVPVINNNNTFPCSHLLCGETYIIMHARSMNNNNNVCSPYFIVSCYFTKCKVKKMELRLVFH